MRALSWMCGLLSLAVVGCGADDGGRGAPGPALVRVAQARDGGLTDTWTTVGEAVALEQAELAVGAQGQVARVLVREGDRASIEALLIGVRRRAQTNFPRESARGQFSLSVLLAHLCRRRMTTTL